MNRDVRPSKSSGRKAPTAIEIKTESKENVPTRRRLNDAKKTNEEDGKTKKRRVINHNNVRVDDLPDFAKDQTWRKTFLPTLYDKFFTSSGPFSQFVKGSEEFISLLQAIMKEVYPNINYKVTASSPIHILVSLTLTCTKVAILPILYPRLITGSMRKGRTSARMP